MRIFAEDTLCIVIDVQEKLIPVIHEKEQIIKATQTFLSCLKELNVPILVTEQYSKGLGKTIPELSQILEESSSVQIMEKITFSAYGTEEIKAAIKAFNKKNVLICGIESHVCVLQTLIDLQNDGYQVTLIEDCAGSRFPKDKAGAIQRSLFEGAMVSTYEAIVFELTQKAGTDTFRKISSLVK